MIGQFDVEASWFIVVGVLVERQDVLQLDQQTDSRQYLTTDLDLFHV